MGPEHPPEVGPKEDTARPGRGKETSTQVTASEISRFYRDAVPKIVAILLKTTSATFEEASEAAHTALIEAVRNWTAIKTNHLSWCITVARRHWGQRKYSIEASFEDVPADSPLLYDANQDVAREVEARLRLDATIGRMKLLTDREREVLDLHLAGLSSYEIGSHLGCNEATVRVHLNNLRRKLDGRTEASKEVDGR